MSTEHPHAPPQPPAVPTVPAVPLWTTILVPPIVTVTSGLLIGIIEEYSVRDPLFIGVPILIAALILGCSLHYSNAVGRRYRGVSFGFLMFSYFFGQIIVCTTLWIGSCMIALS